MQNLEVIKNFDSHISQMYRNIRTNIVFSNKNKDIKSIVITSWQNGEGKSTVLSNLAVLFSNIGKKVLVVDTNYKTNDIEKLLCNNQNVGISEVLIDNESVENCINQTTLENLFVLGTGKKIKNFSELISSDNMKNLINELKIKFDYIFIDTLPINELSDGCVLSNYCDGTILVIGSGEVDKENLIKEKDKLSHVGANILGAVLNKVE